MQALAPHLLALCCRASGADQAFGAPTTVALQLMRVFVLSRVGHLQTLPPAAATTAALARDLMQLLVSSTKLDGLPDVWLLRLEVAKSWNSMQPAVALTCAAVADAEMAAHSAEAGGGACRQTEALRSAIRWYKAAIALEGQPAARPQPAAAPRTMPTTPPPGQAAVELAVGKSGASSPKKSRLRAAAAVATVGATTGGGRSPTRSPAKKKQAKAAGGGGGDPKAKRGPEGGPKLVKADGAQFNNPSGVVAVRLGLCVALREVAESEGLRMQGGGSLTGPGQAAVDELSATLEEVIRLEPKNYDAYIVS